MSIDFKKVAERYNSLDVMYPEEDKWHSKTRDRIKEFIEKAYRTIPNSNSLKTLNAGSAGNSYGIDEKNIFHVDIAEKNISNLHNAIIANIEELPLQNEQFDVTICVGSVLNYCDPIKVIGELSRVLKKDSYIILEFESSLTFELIFKPEFNKNSVFVKTFFGEGEYENLWYFSEKYINRILEKNGFKCVLKKRFHMISPLVYRLTKNENYAARFSNLDLLLSYLPGINRFCSNAIYLFHRK